MRGIGKTTVVLAGMATMTALASVGCGGGEARHTARTPSAARAASLDAPGTTRTTSAALTTTTTTTSTTTTAASTARATPTTTTASTVMHIAIEQCDRAVACKQIGANRAFGDRDECVNAVGHAVVTSLSDAECPSGVDSERLAACASELQASSCDDGAKADAKATPASCARERLCHRDVAEASASRDVEATTNAQTSAPTNAPSNAQTDTSTETQTER